MKPLVSILIPAYKRRGVGCRIDPVRGGADLATQGNHHRERWVDR